jgi:hypothetical protein
MTEAIFPTLLHQDPRYFRKGSGSGWSRFRYAVGKTFWTHRDSGGMQFNYSEIVGNSVAVAISNAYYAGNRTAAKLGLQVGIDTAANILKEFWPDVQRKIHRHKKTIGVDRDEISPIDEPRHRTPSHLPRIHDP